jgi:hypothetical protein
MKALKPVELKKGARIELLKGNRKIIGRIVDFRCGSGRVKWNISIRFLSLSRGLKPGDVLEFQDGDEHQSLATVERVERHEQNVSLVTVCSLLPSTIAALR